LPGGAGGINEKASLMVLAAVDDLMLASKIRAAASRAGVEVVFARSAAEIAARLAAARPALVVVDLNATRFDPLAVIATWEDDESTRGIPTLGFVSHVDSARVAAARAAGIGRVMARSAFFERLPEILREARGSLAPPPAITLAHVQQAGRRIAGHVRRTLLVESDWLSAVSGAEVRLKLESLQVTHSFKARGALNAALALRERVPAGGDPPLLVTASAGNHGRALAWAAERLGLQVVVFTPRAAPRAKLDAIRRHGADLRAEAATYEDAERLAKEYAAARGLAYLSPYSHPDLIAAIGTIAVEVVEDFPDVDTFVVPVGGGGLISGIALAARALVPGVRIVGVEAEASHPFATSVREGRITEVEVGPTLADGLAGNMDPETITFDIVRDHVDELVQVSERDLVEGVRGLVAHEHLIAEGAGVAAVAAVLAGRVRITGRRVAVVVSGSNIDVEKLAGVLSQTS
jgi:threonine dehydratase